MDITILVVARKLTVMSEEEKNSDQSILRGGNTNDI